MRQSTGFYYTASALILLVHGHPVIGHALEQSAIDLPALCRSAADFDKHAMMQGMDPGKMKNMHQGMSDHDMGAKTGMMDGKKGNQHQAMKQHMKGEEMGETQQGLHKAMMAMSEPMMTGMMATDADVAWICSMIPHHQGAIDMARAGLKEADNAESRKLAEETISAQEKEIAKLTAWVENYAKEGSSGAPAEPQ